VLGRRVTAPDGRTWRVRRRWLPWRRRARAGEWVDGGDLGRLGGQLLEAADGPLGAIFLVLGLLVLLAFVVLFVLPLTVVVLELLLVLALLPLVVLARVLLRTPWIVVARTAGPPPEERVEAVSGWRASSRAIDDLAQRIAVDGG
jgi:hypothetical protein